MLTVVKALYWVSKLLHPSLLTSLDDVIESHCLPHGFAVRINIHLLSDSLIRADFFIHVFKPIPISLICWNLKLLPPNRPNWLTIPCLAQ